MAAHKSKPQPKPRLKVGMKYDSGKPLLALLDPFALWEMAKVMTFGAKKYDPYNWQKGIDYSRLFSAAQRHLLQFWAGEDNDPETGLSHLAHALCCCMMLLWHTRNRKNRDDRPHKTNKQETKLK